MFKSKLLIQSAVKIAKENRKMKPFPSSSIDFEVGSSILEVNKIRDRCFERPVSKSLSRLQKNLAASNQTV